MSKELLVIEESTALQVFSSDNGLDPIIKQAKDVVNEFEHDLSTDAGRKRTASLARKVASLKTRLDGMGKDLVAGWKAKAKAVDQNRRAMRDSLDELKVVARQPLTEWEAEQERIKAEEEAAKLQAEIDRDHEMALLMDADFERQLLAKIEEERRIEVERQAKTECQRIENEKRIAEEAAAKAKAEAELKAKQEAELIEREKREAIERERRAKIEAELAEKRRIEAEEKAKQDAAEAEARAKREAEEAAERARLAEIARQEAETKRLAEEQAVREADVAHRKAINNEAVKCFVAGGLSEADAIQAVKLLAAGKVSSASINY